MERMWIRVDEAHLTPAFLGRCLAEVFASLDEHPRRLGVKIELPPGTEMRLDLRQGELFVAIAHHGSRQMHYRRRWLAEHPVPLKTNRAGRLYLTLIPTTGNRVKVRKQTLLERIFV